MNEPGSIDMDPSLVRYGPCEHGTPAGVRCIECEKHPKIKPEAIPMMESHLLPRPIEELAVDITTLVASGIISGKGGGVATALVDLLTKDREACIVVGMRETGSFDKGFEEGKNAERATIKAEIMNSRDSCEWHTRQILTEAAKRATCWYATRFLGDSEQLNTHSDMISLRKTVMGEDR
jgi:hypothetical protein